MANEVVRGGAGLSPVVEPAPPVELRGPAATAESQLELVQPAAAPPETSAPRADPALPAARATEDSGSSRFVQRVADAFAAMSHRGGVVRLRLYPPELGSLRLEIAVKAGKLSARVSAETASAKSLLVENLPALRERLAALDVALERFEVEVREDARQGAFERSDDGSLPWQERRRNTGWHRESGNTEDAAGSNNTWRRPDDTGGRLDIVI